MARAWHWTGRRLPRGHLDAAWQLALVVIAYMGYRLVRGLIFEGGIRTAFENARTLVDIERSMGLFFEPGLQTWLLSSAPWVADAASWVYVNSHFAITLGFVVWLYFNRNRDFYVVRDAFMMSMVLALAFYLLFPTAPPRMLPEWGFTDSVVGLVGTAASQGAEVLYNPYAAVPSMHVAFALMVGIPAARLVRPRALKVLWSAYPVLVTFVVVVTANHFWLDAFIGALVAALSAWIALAVRAASSRPVPFEAPA